MIFQMWKRLDQLHITIKTLWIMIGLLIICNSLLFIGWKSSPKLLRIYLPPDLSQGAMIQPEKITKNTVYAFAYQIFTAINTWTKTGQDDYINNINAYHNYLSSHFYQTLLADVNSRQQEGALTRQRLVSGITGLGYNTTSVKVLGKDTWIVILQLQIQESVDGALVKQIEETYPLLVTRVNTSIQINPWGLEISGFQAPPHRTKTLI